MGYLDSELTIFTGEFSFNAPEMVLFSSQLDKWSTLRWSSRKKNISDFDQIQEGNSFQVENPQKIF